MSQEIKGRRFCCFLFAGLLILSSSIAHSEDWNQWRGASRDGRSEGDAWPDSLSVDALRQVWCKAGLGPSYSGPILQDGIVYTTENTESTHESVVALDDETGQSIWKKSWPVSFRMPRFMRDHGNWPKSTPAVSGEDLVFCGIGEHLHSLDAKTGKERWSIDFPSRFNTPVPEFGCSSSPLLAGDAVYVQAATSLFRIDRRSGEIRWRAYNLSAGGSDRDELEAYGSPILVLKEDQEQIIVNTVEDFIGVDSQTGEVLWKVAANGNFGDSPNITPILWNDLLLISTESSGTPLYQVLEAGDGFKVEEVWRSRVRGNMSSPVVAGDHAYLHLKNGRLAALDLKHRREAWISKARFGEYSSLVGRGDKLLMLTGEGDLKLLAADPKGLRELDTRSVAARTWAHLAAQENRLYVRTLNSLIAYEWSARP